jgi:hypothetical protein
MNRDKDIKKVVADHLQSMVYWKNIDASVVPELIGFLDEVFETWEKSIIKELGQKVLAWEAAMGDDDKSLYTLGIRHSIDAIKGLPRLLTQLFPKSFPIRPANLMSDASHFHYRFAKRSKTHEQSNARILCT